MYLLEMYVFGPDTRQIVDEELQGLEEVITISKEEVDSNSVLLKSAYREHVVTFIINQTNGAVEVEFSLHKEDEQNEWAEVYDGFFVDNLKKRLQENTVQQNGGKLRGGKLRKKNTRKVRKNKRKNTRKGRVNKRK